MSFRNAEHASRPSGASDVVEAFERAIESLALAAVEPLARAPRRAIEGDSRELDKLLGGRRYAAVVTSPPYSNRMSYIRELRPYMYWLGYLRDGRSAGNLDWKAIGGTWGCATSRLLGWQPNQPRTSAFRGFDRIVRRIAERSELLARYVSKYFFDMALHARALSQVVAPGGGLRYVVGNSKFYDVIVPVPQILAAEFEAAGFCDARVDVLRKRSSKAELYEYLVSARRRR